MSPSVLFVCLGNICRSPLAEAAFRKAAEDAGVAVTVDSAGTSALHEGEPPDPRSVAEAARHGIAIDHYRSRPLTRDDFGRFDWIVGMDRANMRDITALAPGDGAARVAMLLDLVPGREGAEVADPWYGGQDNFRDTWDDVSAGAKALLGRVR